MAKGGRGEPNEPPALTSAGSQIRH